MGTTTDEDRDEGGGESVRARLKGVIKVDMAFVLGRFSCCGSQPIT